MIFRPVPIGYSLLKVLAFRFLFHFFSAPTNYAWSALKRQPLGLESPCLLYYRGLWQKCTGLPWISLLANFMGTSRWFAHLREVTLTTGGGGAKKLGEIYPRNFAIPPIERTRNFAIPPILQHQNFATPPYKVCHAYCMISVHLHFGHLITLGIMSGGYEM